MKIVEYLPGMLTGESLENELTILPEYSGDVFNDDSARRLLALNDIYTLYIPSKMTHEIYTKLYMALYRSLQRKDTKEAIIQANNNFRARKTGVVSSSVIGGSDCLTIIGDSGIGKSRTISEVLKAICGENYIETGKPFRKVIPCITVQTPFDSSVKSLLLEILKETDRALNTSYYDLAIRNKATTDVLIMTVSQIALEHIGMIVVDEIQNVIKAKQGRNLVGCLTQLINNSGVAIVMVGTPECVDFFESEMYLGRRAIGLRYGAMPYGNEFSRVCTVLFSYQYVKNKPLLTEDLCYWLWEKTQGNISALLGMVVGAQEVAILNGKEELNQETLQEAYDSRMESMHIFLQPKKRKEMSKTKPKKEFTLQSQDTRSTEESVLTSTFAEVLHIATKESLDQLMYLMESGLVEELAV